MSETAAEVVQEVDPVKETKAKLLTLLITETPHMVTKYEKLISYVGDLLSKSMTLAYARGLSDAAKLLNQETK